MFTFEHHTNILNEIKKYLTNKMQTNSGKAKLYFSGEFDSNQSKFEYGSNNLTFGVLSSNKTVALVLLRFLRIIIDNRAELLMEDFRAIYKNVKIGDKIKLSRLIRGIGSDEKSYMHSHAINRNISVSLKSYDTNSGVFEDIVITKKLMRLMCGHFQE